MAQSNKLNVYMTDGTKRQAEILAELEAISLSRAVSKSVAAYSLLKVELAKGGRLSLTKSDGTVSDILFI